MRFAMFGAGFWARVQAHAWREVGGVELVAVVDPNLEKAQQLAEEFHVPHAFADADDALESLELDFVDIVSNPESHVSLALKAIEHRRHVIVQKPPAGSMAAARRLVYYAEAHGVQLLVNENWRWQRPLRRAAELLREGAIGRPFRAHLRMVSGFDVFANQPALREAERFILMDLGVHLVDTARSWFGESETVYAQVQRTLPDVKGENVATLMLDFSGVTCTIDLAYALNSVYPEVFPQTLALIEGADGTLEILPDYRLRICHREGTREEIASPTLYSWVDPRYAVVQSSAVDAQRNLRDALAGGGEAETTGADNLRSLELVFAAYDSAAKRRVAHINE